MARHSKADRAFASLVRRLAAGDWAVGARLPTVRQLQADFAVSRTTMLAALRRAEEAGLLDVVPRRSITVSPGAEELAGELLADLSSASSRLRVALLLPQAFWPWTGTIFISELIRAVQAETERQGAQLEIVRWPVDDQTRFAYRVIDRGFDVGVALAARASYIAGACILGQQKFPLALFNCVIPGLSLPGVFIDEHGAARKLAGMLAAHGHRSMTMICEMFDARMLFGRHRVNGWFDYMKEAGLAESSLAPLMHVSPDDFYKQAARNVVTVPHHSTAVVFAYGVYCRQFLPAMIGDGVEIPDTLSVATFDAVPHIPGCPRLTTITPDMKRTAECLMEMVTRLHGGEVRPKDVRVPMHINATDSIGPVPES